jgi:nucleoside-diphosphate-sugar epimerase
MKDQASYFKDIGVETVIGDLEDSVDKLSELISGSDAVVFTAGSGGKTGYDKTLLIDLDAAVKCMEAAEAKNIKRFLIVSAMNVDNRMSWNTSPIKPYLTAKHYADRILKSTDLDYTILRPGRLTDDSGTVLITTETGSVSHREIPREDVASTITECLRNENSIGKVFDFVSGKNSITNIVNSL